ncbi:Pseudouridylate synthase [Klebsormidium nitens]|uniref:Pseudouridylate synthase n=1 Tax=Klebsormidium nitens TaxID=105231 RepID=A0A1Y1IJC7_KLENI|nr:Pseudouridylate synthase [Klebsormidium nitens]|eukprot:GAQ89549.1 Pseudouridylate synthase [Klebsormidium nitens]
MATLLITPVVSERSASDDELSLEARVKLLDAENARLKKELELVRKSLVARNVQEALHAAGLSATQLPLDGLSFSLDSNDELTGDNEQPGAEISSAMTGTSVTYVASPEMIAATASAAALAARASVAAALNGGRGGKAKKKAAAAEVDLSHYPRRFVALRIMYMGARYHGFASQPGNVLDMTIESKLFAALEKTRLLPPGGRTQAQYSRCGRTDKGVSALGQVVALWLRSCRRPPAAPAVEPPLSTSCPPEDPHSATPAEPQRRCAGGDSAEALRESIAEAVPHAERGAPEMPPGLPPRKWDVTASVLVHPELSRSVIEIEGNRGEVELSDWSPAGLKSAHSPHSDLGGHVAEERGSGEATDWVLLETEPDEDVGQEFPISRERADDGEWSDGDDEEIDYVAALNRALPEDIRVTGWSPVRPDFDARFSCKFREYKYFFVRGQLDIEAMEKAAARFVGTYDFRNLCRMDTRNVKSFERTIMDCRIERASSSEGWAGCELYYMRVRGRAFLWHQVRCMAAILFMVGHGQESPQIVSELLDLRVFPRKPQYQMASELPLLLHTCGFEDLDFRATPESARQVGLHLERLLHGTLFPAGILREALLELAPAAAGQAKPAPRGHSHVPLKLRGAEPTHEERLQKLGML